MYMAAGPMMYPVQQAAVESTEQSSGCLPFPGNHGCGYPVMMMPPNHMMSTSGMAGHEADGSAPWLSQNTTQAQSETDLPQQFGGHTHWYVDEAVVAPDGHHLHHGAHEGLATAPQNHSPPPECTPEPVVVQQPVADDDYISTASESERVDSRCAYVVCSRKLEEWNPSDDTADLDLDLAETASVTATSVGMNDLVSLCSSENSLRQRERRRRRRRAAKSVAVVAVATAPKPKADAAHKPIKAEAVAAAIGDEFPCKFNADEIKKMMEQVKSGGKLAKEAIAGIRGEVLGLSFDIAGCRLVQEAFLVAQAVDQEAFVSELRGHVRDALRSPHANFVIQKVVEIMPVSLAGFVAKELSGTAAEMARHRYGCRILIRLLEHHSGSDARDAKMLIDELLMDAAHICHHSFARHVVDAILEHGTGEQRHKVAMALLRDVVHNSRNRNASYVVERALSYCSLEDRRALGAELLNAGERFIALAMHDCGSHVVKALLRSQTEHAQAARRILQSEASKLNESKYGKRVLEEI